MIQNSMITAFTVLPQTDEVAVATVSPLSTHTHTDKQIKSAF